MRNLSFLKPVVLNGKIRLGRNYDGGYIVYNRLLSETDALISYGVGWDTSFEEDFESKTGKPVFMFDPSMFDMSMINLKHLRILFLNLLDRPSVLNIVRVFQWWVKLKRLQKRRILFFNEGISPKKIKKFDTFEHHLQRLQLKDKQVLLKIDTEGAEYDVFTKPEIYKSLSNVNQIIFEFHDLKNRLRDAQIIIHRLKPEFDLVHIHANNHGQAFFLYDPDNKFQHDIRFPDALELTFVRRKKISPEDFLDGTESYPVEELDYPNNPDWSDFKMNFI